MMVDVWIIGILEASFVFRSYMTDVTVTKIRLYASRAQTDQDSCICM